MPQKQDQWVLTLMPHDIDTPMEWTHHGCLMLTAFEPSTG